MTTPDSSNTVTRRAVLIGIDAYTKKPLDGCVSDATMMAELLETKFSFEKANITLMLNEAARRDAVLSELDQLVDLTQAGDVAFVFYAGHGSQSINSDNTESSGYDSTFNVSDNPREDILDDEIAERLSALDEKTQYTVMVVDACNSGTLGRSAAASGKERWTPPIQRSELPAAALHASATRGASRSVAPANYVLFSACRDGEIAQEIIIAGDTPVHHGAMSFALVHELQRAVSGDTWREVFDRVARTVSTVHKQQHPQIDGAIDREIFGLRELPPMPFVPVTDRASTTVLLGAGSLQGVIQGSTYTIYPDGTKDVTGVESLGAVEVMLVKGTTSRARITSEKTAGAIVIGTRGVTPQHGAVAAALALENTDPKSRMKGGVTLQILRRDATGVWDVAASDETHGMPVFDSGDRIAFRIISTLDEPVFVNLFDFDPSGTVSTKTKGWANQLQAKGVFEIGTDTRKISMRWEADDAVETFKAFASVMQLDMSWLLQLEQPARGAEDVESLNVDDWFTAVAPIRIRRKLEIPADGRGVAVAGATLTGRGLTGTVRSATNDTAATLAPTGPLAQAIADAGMMTQQSLVITDAKPTGDGTRSANGAPTVELQVPDPGDGFAQVALTTDASGMVSWHFAPPLDDAPATRDGTVPTLRTRTFTFDAKPTTGAGDGERGLVSMIGQKLINVYVFPAGKKLVEHLAAKYGERLELEKAPYRIRTFRADDYTSDTAAEIDSAAWQSLGTGRALLMIHGTNSRTHTAFGGLPRAFVDAMHTQYGGRVFAFDHPTLTHTPRQNIETLLEAMPDGLSLDVDIICHSRGGLVSRVLAEKQAELTFGGRKIRVGSVVFVGSPNAGTRLADEAFIGDYLDTVTNLLNLVPTNGVSDALGFVLTGVKLVATGLWSGLKGLHSMQPEGSFGNWLNTGTRERDTKYFALASDYTPTQAGLMQLATDKLMDRVFNGAHNDLVVPTDGVFSANGSGYFPISEQVVFGATDGVPHTGFFQYPKTTELIATWLRS